MRVLVCGGRRYFNKDRVFEVLTEEHLEHPITVLISGAASGADTLGEMWARNLRIPVLRFPADWHKYGRVAGLIRNRQMIDEGKPERMVAFPGDAGTHNMVQRGREAGIPVRIIDL